MDVLHEDIFSKQDVEVTLELPHKISEISGLDTRNVYRITCPKLLSRQVVVGDGMPVTTVNVLEELANALCAEVVERCRHGQTPHTQLLINMELPGSDCGGLFLCQLKTDDVITMESPRSVERSTEDSLQFRETDSPAGVDMMSSDANDYDEDIGSHKKYAFNLNDKGSSLDMRMFITEAISSAPGGKLTTAAIYKWLQRHVTGLGGKYCDKIKWQTQVRNNLRQHFTKHSMNDKGNYIYTLKKHHATDALPTHTADTTSLGAATQACDSNTKSFRGGLLAKQKQSQFATKRRRLAAGGQVASATVGGGGGRVNVSKFYKRRAAVSSSRSSDVDSAAASAVVMNEEESCDPNNTGSSNLLAGQSAATYEKVSTTSSMTTRRFIPRRDRIAKQRHRLTSAQLPTSNIQASSAAAADDDDDEAGLMPAASNGSHDDASSIPAASVKDNVCDNDEDSRPLSQLSDKYKHVTTTATTSTAAQDGNAVVNSETSTLIAATTLAQSTVTAASDTASAVDAHFAMSLANACTGSSANGDGCIGSNVSASVRASDDDNSELNASTQEDNEPGEYRCDKCHRSFSKPVSLSLHSRTHTRDGKESFDCVVCGKSFASSVGLAVHKHIHDAINRQLAESQTQHAGDNTAVTSTTHSTSPGDLVKKRRRRQSLNCGGMATAGVVTAAAFATTTATAAVTTAVAAPSAALCEYDFDSQSSDNDASNSMQSVPNGNGNGNSQSESLNLKKRFKLLHNILSTASSDIDKSNSTSLNSAGEGSSSDLRTFHCITCNRNFPKASGLIMHQRRKSHGVDAEMHLSKHSSESQFPSENRLTNGCSDIAANYEMRVDSVTQAQSNGQQPDSLSLYGSKKSYSKDKGGLSSQSHMEMESTTTATCQSRQEEAEIRPGGEVNKATSLYGQSAASLSLHAVTSASTTAAAAVYQYPATVASTQCPPPTDVFTGERAQLMPPGMISSEIAEEWRRVLLSQPSQLSQQSRSLDAASCSPSSLLLPQCLQQVDSAASAVKSPSRQRCRPMRGASAVPRAVVGLPQVAKQATSPDTPSTPGTPGTPPPQSSNAAANL